jgi:hypothetical protein
MSDFLSSEDTAVKQQFRGDTKPETKQISRVAGERAMRFTHGPMAVVTCPCVFFLMGVENGFCYSRSFLYDVSKKFNNGSKK